ncbi:MAG: efflux RND transporter permease subunit, partial [Bradymonadaceae bacterium]
AVYRRIHRFQQWASRQPEVLSTQSIVDFHQSARAALLGDPGARDEMPTSSAQVEQLHTLIAGSPDAKAGPGQFVTRDFRKARVLLRVRDVGAQGQLALADRVRGKLRTTFEGVPKVDFRITGDAYAASVALTSFVKDLFYSLLYAGLVILVLMTLIFESVTVGLISMIPNAMPLVVTFGYMGLAGITLNSTTVIIFAIGLGLAVDDTIHVLARFREELHADHASVRDALVETYDSAGRAILFTSVLLLLGMSVLLLSDFLPTQRFGVLISITIVAAILGDLLVLPPILYLLFSDEGTGDEA